MSNAKFDGQVVFHCTRPNLRVEIARDFLRSAVPEYATFPPDSAATTIFENLSILLGRTSSIVFQLNEPENPDLAALRDFWTQASAPNKDYRSIWEQFTLLSLGVHNAWMEEINSKPPDELAAPADLQPDAPDDDTLEALDPNVSERVTN